MKEGHSVKITCYCVEVLSCLVFSAGQIITHLYVIFIHLRDIFMHFSYSSVCISAFPPLLLLYFLAFLHIPSPSMAFPPLGFAQFI